MLMQDFWWQTRCIMGDVQMANNLVNWDAELAWENSQHLVTPPLVSLPNDVWEIRAEIPYWWRVTTQIWVRAVVLLIGRAT